MNATTDDRPHMALWAEAFLNQWSVELKERCDIHDILDWAYELYPEKGHLRPEDVAQAEWEAGRG